MTKILHYYKDYWPTDGGGGVARYIHGLARISIDNGHKVTVISPDCQSGIFDSINVIKSDGMKLLKHTIKNEILHIHGARSPKCMLLALFSKLILGKKIIYTPHCYYDSDLWFKRALKYLWDLSFERALIWTCDRTILLSSHWRDFLQNKGITSNSIRIVPNCVYVTDKEVRRLQSLNKIKQNTTQELERHFFTIGRVSPVKRIDDIINAVSISKSSPKFDIIGKGESSHKLKEIVRDLALTKNVSLLGFQSDNKIKERLNSPQVFIIASEMEGMPTVLIEMLLHSTPVIASNIPGNISILSSINGCRIFNLGDTKQLAKHLDNREKLLVTTEDFQWMLSEYTWQGNFKKNGAIFTASDYPHNERQM